MLSFLTVVWGKGVCWWMKEWGHESESVFNNVESFYFHSSGLQWYVWCCHQSGTAQKQRCRWMEPIPTVEDLMREHILFTTPFTSQRETAAFQHVPVLSHGKPAVPQILEGGLTGRGKEGQGLEEWEVFNFQNTSLPNLCPEDRLRVRQVIMRPLELQ